MWLAFGPEINAWIEDRVGGVAYFPGDTAVRVYDVKRIFIKP